MYDIIIIGAGPAGLTAAIYARRAEKKVLVIEKESFGGQITQSPRVENYPGFIDISGNELADRLLEQVMNQGGEIELDEVVSVIGTPGNYTVKSPTKDYLAKSVIIATGSNHRHLGLEGEAELTGEGISYCAVCDGAFFKGKNVAVIGGGNSALQDAVMLSKTCQKVYIVQNLPGLTGEIRLAEMLEETENVEIIYSSTVKRIIGEQSLKAIEIENVHGVSRELKIDGMFVCIGRIPENGPFADLVELDSFGYVSAGEDCTPKGENTEGIFVAGDCRSKRVRQISTAIADGSVAALAAVSFLESLDFPSDR